MGVQTQSQKPSRTCLLGLLLVTLVVFARVVCFDFVNLDDPRHLDANPYFSPTPLSNLEGIWKNTYLLYMPLTYSVWALIAALSPATNPLHFKYAPMLFHFANLLFHLGSVLVLFKILLRYTPNARWALLAVLLFAIHPVQVEPVAWVSGLKDTLSGFFFLLSLYFGIQQSWISIITFLAALLSKPNVIVFPAVCLFFLVYLERHCWKKALVFILPHAFLAVPFAWITSQLQADHTLWFKPLTPMLRPVVALDTLGFYFTKLLWPFGLAMDYGRTPEIAVSRLSLYLLLGALFLGGLLWSARKNNLSQVGAMIFVISVLPVLGFKAFSFQTTSSVADRYLYLPMIGLALVLLSWLCRSAKTEKILALFFLALFLRATHQVGYWKDTLTMFTHNLEVNPQSWLIHNNLGSYFEKEHRYELALQHYERAGEIKDLNVFHNNRGNVYLILRQFEFAERAFRRALEINPLSSKDMAGLGIALIKQGKQSEAEMIFHQAQALDPTIPEEAWKNLTQKK